MYYNLGCSVPFIANTFEVSRKPIVRIMRKNGWKRRNKSDCKIGEKNPMFGKKHSEESIRKMSEVHKGIKLSEETKKKISEAMKGKKNPFYGKKHTKETLEKLSGENNCNWKGDTVSCNKLHAWVERHKPKSDVCEICGEKKKLELSCIDHKYVRDINQFRRLCRSCHRKYDSELRSGKKLECKT
jgi:hypothetical protein